MLDYTYNWPLVAASLAISLMASFTGLSLTRGLSKVSEQTRQIRIAMAAAALGGGIWSMHFVAILAMSFPIQLGYNPLMTLGSAMVAILLAGLALLMMHYAQRTWMTVALSGMTLGIGIVAMHFLGMAGLERCLPVYGAAGIVAALLLAMVVGIAAVATAYSERTARKTVLATLIFGSSVVVVHFAAMADTRFMAVDLTGLALPAIADTTLAMIVMSSAFVICGAFLLSGATHFAPRALVSAAATDPEIPDDAPPLAGTGAPIRVPYEQNGQTAFLAAGNVAVIRAEGHYTILYQGGQKLFCPWSISQAEDRLPAGMFQRVHRSYLVNLGHVAGFERRKDSGVCLFEGAQAAIRVPVARARIGALREALGV